MRLKKVMKVVCIMLLLSLMVNTHVSAATKTPSVKCNSDWEKAKSVKVGKSYVKVSGGEYGYVKFKATKSGTYKFTIGNVKDLRDSSYMTSMQFALQQKSGDEPQTLTDKSGDDLSCSSIYNIYYCENYGRSPSSYTCKVKNVKKGDVFYLQFYDGDAAKCTLKIKYTK